MKTRSGWVKNGKVVSVAGVVCALAFFLVIRDRGASTGTDGERLAFVPASRASGLFQPRKAQLAREVYGRLPISFEENVGQSAREVSYLSRGRGFELFLTPEEAVLALQNPVPRDLSPRHRFATLRALHQAHLARKAATTTALRMRFEGSNPKAQIAGLDGMPGKVNYFIGNDPKKWRTDVRTFSRVKYTGLYPGVDLIFYGNGRRLEYDFVVSPGADLDAIRLDLHGARKVRINNSGDVVLSLGRGEVLIQKPLIYQVVDGKRREIAGNFVLAGGHELAFQVPHYDRSEPLILDPVLNYSTYLGGSSDEQGSAIAVDANGNVIVAGTSFSTDFPSSSNAFMPQPLAANASGAAFVTEIDPTGTQLKYSTYLAGSTAPFDFAFGVGVDTTGMIYVTGTTVSTDFPTSSTNPNFKAGFKVGLNNTNVNGTSFIVKLDPAATTGQNSLLYSSYIGGTNGTQVIGDIGQNIAVDANGVAYVTGYTDSSPGTSVTDLTGFPVVGGFQTNLGSANGNAFLAKIDTTQSGAASLLYSTYFGGNAVNFNSATDFIADVGNGVVIDSNSNAYVTGVTYSKDLAVTANAVQTAYPTGNSTNTAFLARVNTTQTGSASLAYLSYLGGTGPDFGDAIALGPNNVAYMTGQSRSLNFPTTAGAYSTSGNISGQVYVTLVNTNAAVGAPPAYSTFLGGTGGDDGFGIRVDATGNAYVAGGTSSSDFPITSGAFQSALATNAAGDGFVFKLNPGGNGNADLLYSTYFGGSGSTVIDQIAGIAIDASNNVYVTGVTASGTTFPVFPNPGAFRTTLNGTSDAFVTKLTLIPTLAVVPTSLNFGTQPVGVASTPQTVTVTNNNNVTVTFSSIAINGANNADFSKATDTCSPSVAAGAQCTVSVTFTPSAPATLNEVATLVFTDSDVNSPQDVSLSGSGSASAPGVVLAPTSLSFGNQTVNTTSAAQTVTLTNTGNAALTINTIAASGDFAETSTGATACPISPATLPATAGSNTCTISVTFTPTVAGARTGTLTITDNAGGSPQMVSLTGNGTSPPPDFTLGAAPTTMTVAQGAVSTPVTITVNPTNGFNSAVALTCAGAPTNSICTLSPASITPPTTSALTFTAHAMLVPLPMTKPAPPLNMLRIVPLFFVLVLLFLLRSTQRFRTRLAMVSAMIVCVTLAACSGPNSPNNKTAKGSYPLTITGTSGALTHNATVTVTVN